MASDTRERVLSTARDMVHGSSYAEVGVEDVCRAAGVNKGSLYHFFPSKAALGVAVLERDWELMAAVLDEALDREEPPLDRLDRFVRAFTAFMATMRERLGAVPGCPIGNLAAELPSLGEDMRTSVADVVARFVDRIAGAVREAQVRGDVDSALDPQAAARTVVALVQGMAVLAKAQDDVAVLDPLPEAVRRLLPPPA